MSVRVLIPLTIIDDLLSGIISRVRPKDGRLYKRGARIVAAYDALELSWTEVEEKPEKAR